MMPDRDRVMKLLSAVNGHGLSAAEIGDICNIRSIELDPMLLKLMRRQCVVAFWDGGWPRRRMYRLGPKANEPEQRRRHAASFLPLRLMPTVERPILTLARGRRP